MQDVSFPPLDDFLIDDEESVEETIQLCIFELADKLFGLSIFEVQEIMEDAGEITPVPTTPHFMRGVINLRGNIVPVVDIREVLNIAIKKPTKESRIMILNIGQVQLGILVDSIREVTRLEKYSLHPESVQVGISDGKFIDNIIQYRDGFLVLLNLMNIYQAIQL